MNLPAGGDDSGFMSKIKNAGSGFSMTHIMYIVAAILLQQSNLRIPFFLR